MRWTLKSTSEKKDITKTEFPQNIIFREKISAEIIQISNVKDLLNILNLTQDKKLKSNIKTHLQNSNFDIVLCR